MKKTGLLLLCLICAVFVFMPGCSKEKCASCPEAPAVTCPKSSQKASMTARWGLAADSIGNTIYAAGGGYGSGSDSNALEAYNTSTNTWTILTNMPDSRWGHALVAYLGKIYLLGGDSFAVYTNNWVYDPAANTWSTTLQAMPTGRDSFAAAELNGRIYAVGGRNSSYNNLASMDVYDVASNTWDTTKQAMSAPRQLHALVAHEGRLYAIGGHNGGLSLSLVEEYDPVLDAWSSKQSMPTARHCLAAVSMNGRIYAIGGTNSDETVNYDTIEEYNPASNSWRTLNPMPVTRKWPAAAVVYNKFYFMGGGNINAYYGDLYEADLSDCTY